jgi:2'-5' RNA ligase
MRLFFALWPPAEAARALAQWAGEVQKVAGGRATAEETIHLTLAFLGEADPAKAVEAAQGVAGEPFDLNIEVAKYWKHNRILWAGPQNLPDQLKNLVRRLHAGLREKEFAIEHRPFAAHISLVRKANPPGSIPPLPRVRWPANEFVLVRSVPSGRGSRYEAVHRFPLHART